jgi:hypothetical protein
MGKQGENLLRSFEKKVLQKIFGPVLENGCWKRRKNSQIYTLYDEYDDVKCMKLIRLRRAGNVMRMEKVTLQGKSFVLNREELETEEEADRR